MNEYDVKRLALVLSAQAEVEAMKSENERKRFEGAEPKYTEEDFRKASNRLSDLAYCHNEQVA